MGRPRLSRRALLAAAALGAGGSAFAATPFPSLARIAARSGRVFGAAVEPEQLERDPAFAALVQDQCASLTAENVMKWDALRPGPETFAFDRADRLAAQARAMGAQLYGHCLLWHEAWPAWLPKEMSAGAARSLIEQHIQRVAGRYAGVVTAWDVVNEAVERNDRRPDGLRVSPWLKALGPDYVPLAFEAARSAAPRARLAFADYGLEYDDVSWMVEKRGTMLALLKRWKGEGVPIDALAIQGHLDASRPPSFGAGLRRFLAQVADLGLEIYVTELDVDDQKVVGDPARRDAVVADCYARFLDAVMAEPAVRRVTTWGLSDRYSSKAQFSPRPDGAKVRPLPFDDGLRPKRAADALQRAFDHAR
ncbi:endo-1,4-beta-xylanase [Caulobacter hibisci]|uniref:Beta-xylanase n=1 Tax=Caulobacter hibisci TaxID=2035993 RepID=A0ABS0STW6_9CAUL|nr:endo-1,4-beta-xylanase [Caulobacter hibisci]MBI1682829.1 endo-1,4-beta-xylanase [Caulobacter hibisci]